MESLPPKVWLIIFLFLPLNDLTEASAVCKIFFGLTRRNSLFTEKLLHSRILFNNSCVIFDCCKNAFLSFYHQLCFSLEKNIPRMKIKAKGKGNYNGKIDYFRVWNHFFFCVKDLNIVLTCACIVQNCILVIKNCQTILTNICMCQLNSSLFLLETVLL